MNKVTRQSSTCTQMIPHLPPFQVPKTKVWKYLMPFIMGQQDCSMDKLPATKLDSLSLNLWTHITVGKSIQLIAWHPKTHYGELKSYLDDNTTVQGLYK